MTHSPVRRIRRTAALALTLAIGVATVIAGAGIPAQAATTYTITGTVTGHTATGSAPLAGASVSIYEFPRSDASAINATTDASGTYSVTVPSARAYAAHFHASGYAPEWSGNTADSASTTPITVTELAPTATRNMTMATSSSVSGRIVDQQGRPISGSPVHVRRLGQQNSAQALTDAKGNYTVTGVGEGTFVVEASSPWDPGATEYTRLTYIDSFYGGTTSEAKATRLTITPSSKVTAKNVALPLSPTIKFRFVDAANKPIAGIYVLRLTLNTVNGLYESCQCGNSIGSSTSGWSASFGQRGESYKYIFLDARYAPADDQAHPVTRSTIYESEWYDNAKTQATATAVTYSSSSSTQKMVTVTLAKNAGSPVYLGGLSPVLESGNPVPTLGTNESTSFSPARNSYTRQWLRDGVAVAGETGYQYVISAADEGAEISLRVSARFGTATVTRTSVPYTVASSKSVTGTVPTITGTRRVGSTVSAASADWAPTTATKTYKWFLSGAAVSGATSSTFALPSSAAGKKVTVMVTARQSGYTTLSKTSAGKTVASGVFTKVTPTISGKAKVGSRLTLTRGPWSPASGTTFTYRWYVKSSSGGAASAISGATSSTYTISSARAAKYIAVRVTAKRPGYTTATLTSAYTAKIAG